MTPQSAELARVAVTAARLSGDYLLRAFRSGMSVQDKGSAYDRVTEHDYASEQILREALTTAVPGSVVHGEEGGLIGNAAVGVVTWIVDPIDGTVNFAAGIAFWCVSIAAAVDGRIVAGVILDPVAGLEFVADATGVTLNGLPLSPGPAAPESAATILCTFPRFHDLDADQEAAVRGMLELTRASGAVRSMGSGALGLAHVTAGWADLTFDLHTNPWDVAAGMHMLLLAGGSYVGLTQGEMDPDPLTAYRHHGYVACAPGGDYPRLSESVRRVSAATTRCICTDAAAAPPTLPNNVGAKVGVPDPTEMPSTGVEGIC